MIKGMQEVIDVMTKAKADLTNGGLKQVILWLAEDPLHPPYPAIYFVKSESSVFRDITAEFVNATPEECR